MNRTRRRLWLVSLIFILLGVAVGLLYQKLRGGEIRLAEGRRLYEAGRFDLAESSFQQATRLALRASGGALVRVGARARCRAEHRAQFVAVLVTGDCQRPQQRDHCRTTFGHHVHPFLQQVGSNPRDDSAGCCQDDDSLLRGQAPGLAPKGGG